MPVPRPQVPWTATPARPVPVDDLEVFTRLRRAGMVVPHQGAGLEVVDDLVGPFVRGGCQRAVAHRHKFSASCVACFGAGKNFFRLHV